MGCPGSGLAGTNGRSSTCHTQRARHRGEWPHDHPQRRTRLGRAPMRAPYVGGISATQFQAWWETALDDVHGVVFPAFPEHYRLGWVADPQGGPDDVFLIIEELGHVPFRMYCTFPPSWAPVEVSPGFEIMQPGVGRLHDGTEVVRLMNQIKDTDTGFAMRAAVFMVSGVPEDVVTSHIDQEVVEWTRWLEMAPASVGIA